MDFICIKVFRSALPKPQLLMLKVWSIGWRGFSLAYIAEFEPPLWGLFFAKQVEKMKQVRTRKKKFSVFGSNEKVAFMCTPRRCVEYSCLMTHQNLLVNVIADISVSWARTNFAFQFIRSLILPKIKYSVMKGILELY